MEHRFQRILLKIFLSVLFASSTSVLLANDTNDSVNDSSEEISVNNNDHTAIDSEFFDVGLFFGMLNIEDFGSEPVTGINATFMATENFFLQLNYLEANASLSSYEKSQGALFSGNDRNFTHGDLLLGYHLVLGEHFLSGSKARLSSLYAVGGIGDTQFGGEERFTYTLGLGYQVNLNRSFILRVDFRDYIFKSNLLKENNSTHNNQLSIGINFLF